MIRLVQRKLIIPCGDTGTFTVPVLPIMDTENCIAVFTIFNSLTQKRLLQKQATIEGDLIRITLEHDDTADLPAGRYYWDIRIWKNPVYEDQVLVNGTEINSYYAAYTLPECELRPTSDSVKEDIT